MKTVAQPIQSSIPDRPEKLPQGSRRMITCILRSLAQGMEEWADRLESALIHGTATLPDSWVRRDWLAALWRIWLRVNAQIYARLPAFWADAIVTVLPIALGLGLSVLVWTTIVPAPSNPNPVQTSDRMEKLAPPVFEVTEIPSDSEETAMETLTNEAWPEMPALTIAEENQANESLASEAEIAEPIFLGPPLPSESLPTPLEIAFQENLIQSLKRSWQPLVQSLHLNIAQGELTLTLSPQWADLNSKDQVKLAQQLAQRSCQLNVPRLFLVDSAGHPIARSAIVGNAMVFTPTF